MSHTIPLSNHRIARLRGTGPPIVFSSGLYGICPHQAYSKIGNLLSKNLTIINVEGGIKFMSVEDVESVADALKVEKVGFFAHSSFDPDILKSSRVTKAVLCDPIGTPKLSNIMNFKFQPYVETDIKTLQVKAKQLYEGKFELPTLNQWEIEGDVTTVYMDSGHVDLMDDSWVWIADNIGFWEMLRPPATSFENFEFTEKKDLIKMRNDYRRSLATISTEFFLK
tara:strand:- start:1397 stop:2068 length:672 start_codon:yes stop_codon:yes gene_type:complete